ncbi:hypothetical protein N0V93_009656 [Gnomoniopsis smithogilvyi]|uniref:Uncharacterized protein n=1 Tax=Gnomoniopsis smithogilvyi TaxID=1191159 RepID=A0A9W9CTV8_9PEZI|nr:hypothetical protein N0V93_009656 [Gnomoniopsis smithogilvyi]
MEPRLRFVTDERAVDAKNGAQTVKVICAGLPRCATSSLQAALEGPVVDILPCMHMAHVAPHPDRLKLCLAAMAERDNETKRQEILRTLFAGYAASADFPGILFIDDLMDSEHADPDMMPEVAICTVYKYLCLLWETDRLHYKVHYEFRRLKFSEKFGTKADIASEEFYESYNNWVRKEAKKRGRPVLEWQAQDGYAPLCKFLGKRVPESGTTEAVFPHLNDVRQMQILKAFLIIRGLLSWALVGIGLWTGWQYGGSLLSGFEG